MIVPSKCFQLASISFDGINMLRSQLLFRSGFTSLSSPSSWKGFKALRSEIFIARDVEQWLSWLCGWCKSSPSHARVAVFIMQNPADLHFKWLSKNRRRARILQTSDPSMFRIPLNLVSDEWLPQLLRSIDWFRFILF